MISHVKCKVFCTNVEINNPILGDNGKTIVHVTKDLKMFTLVIDHNTKICHENINLAKFYNCHKITNEDIPSSSKFDQSTNCLQQW
jgi:hypothetical protein